MSAPAKLDCQDRFRDRKGKRKEREKGARELDLINRGKKIDTFPPNLASGSFFVEIS